MTLAPSCRADALLWLLGNDLIFDIHVEHIVEIRVCLLLDLRVLLLLFVATFQVLRLLFEVIAVISLMVLVLLFIFWVIIYFNGVTKGQLGSLLSQRRSSYRSHWLGCRPSRAPLRASRLITVGGQVQPLQVRLLGGRRSGLALAQFLFLDFPP